MRAKEFLPENKGLPNPGTYEQEYGAVQKHGPRRITAMTYEDNKTNTVTLSDLYDGDYPDDDEMIWNFVGQMDFDIPFVVNTISPTKLKLYLTSQYHVEHIDELFDMMDDDQRGIVDYYCNDSSLPNQIIVIADGRIIDGNHRAMAAALTNKPIKYIDVAEEQLNEIDHASETTPIKWDPSYKDRCEKVGYTEGFDIYYMPDGSNKMFMVLDDDGKLLAYVTVGHSKNFPDRMSIHRIENVSGKAGLATTLVAGLRQMGAKFVIDADEPLTPSGLKWVLSLIRSNRQAFNIMDQDGNPIEPNKLAREREDAIFNKGPGPTSILIEFSEVVQQKLKKRNSEWLLETLLKPYYVYLGDGRLL